MMDKDLFERNVLALSESDPVLCARLSAALTTTGTYRFIESRSGDPVPALTGPEGQARPLHSTVDPRREGERLVSTLAAEGCIIFLGLGAAYAAEAALLRSETKKLLVIEYGRNGLAELLSSRDYIGLFRDPRFRILLDPSEEEIKEQLLNSYIPVLDNGIRVFPLRTRIEGDRRFDCAASAIKDAIAAVSRDYSVQAYFGRRWFSNIIRNLPLAENQIAVAPVKRAAICAAGPSLEKSIPEIRKRRDAVFLAAADTALPALLHAGIEPDGVVSIDCQHISYRHFFGTLPERTILFLDLASPPPVAARAERRVFFSSAHPLGLYIRRFWRSLPLLDTSGANVTYAAYSLAESLGAGEITLYGADFSYPQGKTYARGTYLYPYFEQFQSRVLPLEAQHSAFLYRDPALEKCPGTESAGGWYYETPPLRFYREGLDRKAALHAAAPRRGLSLFSAGPAKKSAAEFLASYKQSLLALSSFSALETAGSMVSTGDGNHETELAATLLPLAAAVRKTSPGLSAGELFEEVRAISIAELSRLYG